MPINKYFIAIVPDSEISSRIILFRKKYLEGLNVTDEHKKIPHITLQHTFSRPEFIEEEIQPYLISLAKRSQPFEIKLSGVGHFERRVIYIDVEANPILLKLYEELKNILLNDLKFISTEVAVKYHPHITLEKKITKEDFNSYWKIIENEKFEGKFLCNSFSLMRHNGKIWKELERFDFNDTNTPQN